MTLSLRVSPFIPISLGTKDLLAVIFTGTIVLF